MSHRPKSTKDHSTLFFVFFLPLNLISEHSPALAVESTDLLIDRKVHVRILEYLYIIICTYIIAITQMPDHGDRHVVFHCTCPNGPNRYFTIKMEIVGNVLMY